MISNNFSLRFCCILLVKLQLNCSLRLPGAGFFLSGYFFTKFRGLKLSEEQLVQKFREVKLIVTDIDGTLVNNEGKLGELTTEMIRSLSGKGVLFTFATQRVFSSVIPFADALGIDIPMITMNGALIADRKGGIIYKAPINVKKVKKAIEFANRYYLRIALCRTNEIVYTDENSVIKEFMNRRGAEYMKVDSYYDYLDDVLELIISGDNKKAIKKIQSKLNFPLKLHVHAKYFRSRSMKDVFHLEVLRSHVNKKHGLKLLTKHLGIKKRELAVMGDWYNDRQLFDFGGTNIALENAVPELKNKANFITTYSNNEDGLGHFLKRAYPDLS